MITLLDEALSLMLAKGFDKKVANRIYDLASIHSAYYEAVSEWYAEASAGNEQKALELACQLLIAVTMGELL